MAAKKIKKISDSELAEFCSFVAAPNKKKEKILRTLHQAEFSLSSIKDVSLRAEFIRKILLWDSDKERLAFWISKIATEEWKSLFPLPGNEVCIPYDELFKAGFNVDRNRLKNPSLFWEVFQEVKPLQEPLDEMYRALGMSLHFLKTYHPKGFDVLRGGLGNNLASNYDNFFKENASFLSEYRHGFNEEFLPLKKTWSVQNPEGEYLIVDLLLSLTPSVEKIEKEKFFYGCCSNIKNPMALTRTENGYHFSPYYEMWNLPCECAEAGNIPKDMMENYGFLNNFGLWRKNYYKKPPRWDCFEWGLGGKKIASAARILAENVKFIETHDIPDKTLFESHYPDNHIPPIVFAIHSAYDEKTKEEFDIFMQNFALDRIKRFGKHYSKWAESKHFREVILKDLSPESSTNQRILNTYVQNKNAHVKRLAEFDRIGRDDYMLYLSKFQWSTEKLAAMVIDVTGWCPSDISFFEQNREWVDALFVPLSDSDSPEPAVVRLPELNNPRLKALASLASRADLLVPEGTSAILKEKGNPVPSQPLLQRMHSVYLMTFEGELQGMEPSVMFQIRANLLESVTELCANEVDGTVQPRIILNIIKTQYEEFIKSLRDEPNRNTPPCLSHPDYRSDREWDSKPEFTPVYGEIISYARFIGDEYRRAAEKAGNSDCLDEPAEVVLRGITPGQDEMAEFPDDIFANVY